MDRKEFNTEGHVIVSSLYDASMRLHNLMTQAQGETDTLTAEWWTLNAASKALGSAIDTLSLLTGYAVGAKGRPSMFPEPDRFDADAELYRAHIGHGYDAGCWFCQTEMAEKRDDGD